MKDYLRRTLFSQRWQFLRPYLGPYVLPAGPSEQWLRVVMNREVEALVRGLGPARLSVLEISGNAWERPGFFRSYESAEYPEFDVCAAPLARQFDLVIAEQVFEHLLWPYRAGKNVRAMVKPGGHFLITTPFLLRIHEHPFDCSRWTELGLKCLLAECGFDEDLITTGSWGNRECVEGNLERWQVFQPWRHSLKNDPKYPIVVWALAGVSAGRR